MKTLVGKYHVQRILGRGGMGTVYEALDPHLNRRVALKTMIQGLSTDPDLRARFLREAQAAGGLRHRNIVTVYDLGEDKGQPYIAMEFIEGTDLERVIQHRESRPIEWKIDVLRQICEGLGHAHRGGIIHRDVKPANIRVTPEGEVKIMDFGIAHLQSSSQITRGGQVLGTVHYMAPEQVGGGTVDQRADIFAVGAIAYELLSYRRAFDGDSLTAVMYRIAHEPADAAALPKTAYSPGLEAIVMKAMARDLKERYQSLDEMGEDLERLVSVVSLKKDARPDPARAETWVSEGERVVVSDPEKALDLARRALVAAPGHPGAEALVRKAEAEALRKRVETEMAALREEVKRAKAEGSLQKALGVCQRLRELDPDDAEIARMTDEIQSAIRSLEIQQLCSQALAYVAEGDTEFAQKIAAKIEKLDPHSPKFIELRNYLREEESRKTADMLVATAREHVGLGNLAEARAAAEEALALYPSHTVAREIRDSATRILSTQEGTKERETAAAASMVPPAATAVAAVAQASVAMPEPLVQAAPEPPLPTVSIPAAPRATEVVNTTVSEPPLSLTPLPEGTPSKPEAARLLETARRLLRDRLPRKALEPLAQAAALEPSHAGIQRLLVQTQAEARREEIETLTTAALNAFVENKHKRARQAVEQALALDPDNRKAKELLKILGALD